MNGEPYGSALAIFAIRLFRWVPRTAAFDKHLTDCAAIAVFWGADSASEPLRLSHVLRMRRMPKLLLSIDQRTAERVEIPAIARYGEPGRLENPEALNMSALVHNGSKAIN